MSSSNPSSLRRVWLGWEVRNILFLFIPKQPNPRLNTMNCEGKNKRRGMVVGKTAKTKKAIVTLTAESKDIEIFAGL